MLDIGREITKEAITPAVCSGVFCLILAVGLLVFGLVMFRTKD